MSSGIETSGPRERILDAAAEEFGENGFAGARIDGIARRAGVNKAAIYYHVGDKRALFSKVVIRTIGEVSENLSRDLAKEPTAEGRIRTFIRNVTQAVGARKWLPGLMMREAASGGRDLAPEAARAITEMFGFFQNELKSGIAAGRFRSVDTITAHLLGVGGVLFFFSALPLFSEYIPASAGSSPDAREFADSVSDILLNGLLRRPVDAGAVQTGLMHICLPL